MKISLLTGLCAAAILSILPAVVSAQDKASPADSQKTAGFGDVGKAEAMVKAFKAVEQPGDE